MRIFSIILLCFVLIKINVGIVEAQNLTSASLDKKLVVGIILDPPYTIKNVNGKWTGLSVDLWSHVAHDLKLNYEFKEMRLDEMLAALQKGKIDISIAALFVTNEREKLFDFSVPFGNTRLAVATRPHTIDHPWWAAISIFFSWGTLKVIGFLLFVLLFVGFLLWLIERRHNPEHFGGGLLKGIVAAIYWVGTTMASGVCFGINIKSLTGRIVALTWILICAIALSAFIASLSSSLTLRHISTITTDFDTFKNMHLGTVNLSIPAGVLERRGVEYSLFPEEEDVLKALMDKKIDGFLFDEMTLRYYAEKDYQGKISVYPTNLKRLLFAFGIPMGSPLRKQVNPAILNVMNEPIWEFLLNRYGFGEDFEEKPYRWRRKR